MWTAIVLVGLLALATWVRRGKVPSWASRVVEGVDEWHQEPEVKVPRVSRLALEMSVAAKAHFGELRYNNANRIVVRDYLYKWVRETKPDLRNIDLVLHMPMAVELALLPSMAAVQAQQFAVDPAVRERRSAVSLPK